MPSFETVSPGTLIQAIGPTHAVEAKAQASEAPASAETAPSIVGDLLAILAFRRDLPTLHPVVETVRTNVVHD